METQVAEIAIAINWIDDVDAAIEDAYAALPVGSDQQNQNYRDR